MKTRLLFCLLMLSTSGPLSASELSRSRAELDTLANKIDSLQQSLNANIASEKSLTSALDQLEFAQSGLRKKIQGSQSEKAALEAGLAALVVQSKSLSSESEEAKERLGGLLRSGYLLGKQSALRMFVNQQDPHTAARRLTMFNYVIEARNRQLERFTALQESLEENREQSETKRQEIQKTIAELDTQKASLAEKESRRLKERDKLQLAMADNNDALAGYQQRQKSLEKLIKQLSRPKPKPKKVVTPVAQSAVRQKVDSKPASREDNSVVRTEGEAGQSQVASNRETGPKAEEKRAAKTAKQSISPLMTLAGFGKSKGRLPRPLSAKVRVRFGDKKQESGLRWDGVLFSARDKQAVQVIYPGQVVFSDWFRGYGQLMVVDHGEGYMSLYGHNQQLNVAVGDQVQSGQTIAMASDGSDRPLPGLYFEIRHNGTPDDPLKWVK